MIGMGIGLGVVTGLATLAYVLNKKNSNKTDNNERRRTK